MSIFNFYVAVINRNRCNDRQLKAEVDIFRDWLMMNDSCYCPLSSAREKEKNESVKLPSSRVTKKEEEEEIHE